MDSLSRDPLYFVQVTGSVSGNEKGVEPPSNSFIELAAATIAGMLGADFPIQWDGLYGQEYSESRRDLAIFDALSKLLPMSSQKAFFWRKLAKPFSAMLDTAGFPPHLHCRFLIFVYARVIGMMGPHNHKSEGSFMTFDGSPVEMSWVIPKEDPLRKAADRQIRFAIEPIDPRTGELLGGDEVLNYLVSPSGSLGVVDCQGDAMIWRKTLEAFLFPDASGPRIPKGSKFFVGFDFSSNGRITLKAYYIPSPRAVFSERNSNYWADTLRLWDHDWTKLRNLVLQLNPLLSTPLEKLISFINGLDEPLRPRIQILSVDCVSNSVNRLKIYCRPKEGASWGDACRTFTLGGKLLSSPSMTDTLGHLETLWNDLFPSCLSTSGRQLRLSSSDEIRNGARLGKRNTQHPSGGLLFYFSLHPTSDIPLPKIYLPVSRYCRNDLQICNAVEQVYRSRGPCLDSIPKGWVSREVSKAFDYRGLKVRTGIHTYITLAYKGKGWEVTSYFSPEVWSHKSIRNLH